MVTTAQVFDALREVIDPEMGINILDLGLIYEVKAEEELIEVNFTLTYPGCPAADDIQQQIVWTLGVLSGLPEERIRANLVWEPRWGPQFMSEEARLALGYPI